MPKSLQTLRVECPACHKPHTMQVGKAFRLYVERFQAKVTCSEDCKAVLAAQTHLEASG